ncbi:MAG: glycerophosphodiester phosphodiesterase family protein [Psychrobium sp.]
MKKILLLLITLLSVGCQKIHSDVTTAAKVKIGVRPLYLVNDMDEGPLKKALQQCKNQQSNVSHFSIGHRGAPLFFPEHTQASYQAAADMGAGIIECDVTFTKDKQLVCRHSQCDLHTTTNILQTPLAKQCTEPFISAQDSHNGKASAKCCTSDITLSQFKTLSAKMDGANTAANTINEYVAGTPSFRSDLYSQTKPLLTHQQSIHLFKSLGVKMTPELKQPNVAMPYQALSQQQLMQQLVDEYKTAQVPASDVFIQSFDLADIDYLIANEPAFSAQAVYLEDRAESAPSLLENRVTPQQLVNEPQLLSPTMSQLKSRGVNIIAPPTWALLNIENDQLVPSAYAKAAKKAGLKIIAWSLERSGKLSKGGGWYYQSVASHINNDGDVYKVLDVLAKDVGVIGVFSDWPATTTFYANCMGYQ